MNRSIRDMMNEPDPQDPPPVTAISILMSSDVDLHDRLKKATKEVESLKKNISQAATDYNKKYEQEITEGTKARQLLLTEGRKKGMSDDEIMATNTRFLPTVQTPILNFLYFLLRDEHRPDWEGINKQLFEQHGHVAPAATEKELEHMFGQAIHQEEKYEGVKEPDSLETYIYGNCTHSMFQTIKKLKTLALSDTASTNEAAIAFATCKKLCQKYGLDFEKLPTNIK